jgi:hypothetical protein
MTAVLISYQEEYKPPSSGDSIGGLSRALVGTVEITQTGSYTVTAGPAIEGGVEPKILLGKCCEGARKRNPLYARSGRSG